MKSKQELLKEFKELVDEGQKKVKKLGIKESDVSRLIHERRGIKMTEMTYKKAGVNISAADKVKKKIKQLVKQTYDSSVELSSGHFAGAINLSKLNQCSNPLLVSSIDGAGTKTKLAALMNKWDSIGFDLVNHSVNDILCVGARPLFFSDYIASSKLNPRIVEKIISGLSKACKAVGIPLISGETAIMPGVYCKGELDLAGAITGYMDKTELIDGSKIKKGDQLIGLKSNGLHTNGYSLARKVLIKKRTDVRKYEKKLKTTIGKALLEPHKSYLKAVEAARKKVRVKGIAHITGGGLQGNIVRILPKDCGARINKSRIKVPAIFELIQERGKVPEQDMFHTFNMGIGLVLVVGKKDAEKTLKELKKEKETACLIGEIVKGKKVVELI